MKYLEAARMGNETIRKYENLLSLYGCQDIEVDFGLGRGDDKDVLIHKIELYFWNNKYGYDIEVYHSDKGYDTNDFLKDCEDIFSFLKDLSILETCDFKTDFPRYFKTKGIEITTVSSLSKENFVLLYFLRNSTKCSFRICRRNATKTILEPFEECEDDISPTDKIWKHIEEFESNFSNYIIDKLKQSEWTVKINVELSKITLNKKQSNGIILSYDILSYYHNLFEGKKITDIFCEIIYHLLKSNEPLKDLKKQKYHIVSNPKNSKSCFLFKKAEKFEIQYDYIKTSDYVGLADSGDIPKWFINFDDMDGHQFEHFCANVLTQNGFENVSVTSGSGDQGVDIIAYKDDIKYGIQCKCYHSDIGNKAVQEVYAGKTFYDCNIGIVLTNRDFTRSAIDLAKKDGIILWNRTKLLQMIENCTEII